MDKILKYFIETIFNSTLYNIPTYLSAAVGREAENLKSGAGASLMGNWPKSGLVDFSYLGRLG